MLSQKTIDTLLKIATDFDDKEDLFHLFFRINHDIHTALKHKEIDIPLIQTLLSLECIILKTFHECKSQEPELIIAYFVNELEKYFNEYKKVLKKMKEESQ